MNTHPSWKKKLCILCLCIALLCAGCSQTAHTGSSSIGESTASESTTQSRETYTYSDYELDDSYDEGSAALITLSGDSAESNGTGVTISGSTVTISREGCYILRGELTDGQIIVDAGDTDQVQLVLDGVSITCSDSSPILVRNADKVKVTLAADSENTLTDGASYAEDDDNPDAALFSKDDLILNGSGTLTATGNYKHGIAGNDDLVITGGTYNVTSVSHALRGNDSVCILDGTFNLTSEKDGIQASNIEDADKGWVQIDSGTYTITSSGDGIQAETDLAINGGDFTILSGGGAENGPNHTDSMMFGGGLIASYMNLKSLGLTGTIWAVLLPACCNAYYLILTRTFFEQVPIEMEESAKIDGASDLTIFSKIYLPVSKPIISTMILFFSVERWNSWFSEYIYLPRKEQFPLQLVLRQIVIAGQMDVGAAALSDEKLLSTSLKYSSILLAVLPMLIIYPLLQKYLVKGIMLGAVKG